ncbi:hypothetical protein [Rubritalea tangerina]|uniref:Uncharacterized protein n=1 Tax=Rubritalea tangerina TaxID=430798 RepID=A0ABW4ZBL8_9BACT
MDEEKAKLKTVRVRINVDEQAPPRTRTGEIIHELVAFTKKLIPFSTKEGSNKEEK